MISEDDLSRLSIVVDQQTGLHFPQARFTELRRTLRQMAKDNGHDSADSCLAWLLSDASEQQCHHLLVKYLTVGETYFLRDRPVFDVLKNRILPERLRARQQGGGKRLKLWSAACASGEEAYSIAITLDQVPKDGDWQFDLLGTDINREHLARARAGLYGQWSFRGSPAWLKDLYFLPMADNQFQLRPRIMDMVSFSTLNLAKLGYPAPFDREGSVDVIFCRNVLMYFSAALQQEIVAVLSRLLAPAGWLIVSPCETGIVKDPALTGERIDDFLFFRKSDPRQRKKGGAPARKAVLPPTDGARPSAGPPPRAPGDAGLKAGAVLSSKAGREGSPGGGPPVVPAPPSGEDLYRQAEAHYQAKQYELAAGELNRLLGGGAGVEDPVLAGQALALLARLHGDQGQLALAGHYYQQAIQADKLNPGHYFHLAMLCQELGEHERAVQNLKKVIYLDHDVVMAHFHLGILVKGKADRQRHLRIACDLLQNVEADAHLPYADEMIAGRILETAKSLLLKE